MNKWQVICPLVLLLAAGLWVAHKRSQTQTNGMRYAIESHLLAVLAVLENHPDRGRFPTAEVARTILDGEEGQKALHGTSLLTIRDLLYNRAQPPVGSDAFVLSAYVGETLFAIRANRAVREIPVGDSQLADFVRLVKIEVPTGPQSVGVSNR